MRAAEPHYLTVSELTSQLNLVLEEAYPRVYVLGEIGELARPQSGHLYFTLRDEKSQLSAVMWRSSILGLRFAPQVGARVQCEGRFSVYAGNGRLQVVVQSMVPAGEGELHRRFAELKAKLEKEGLFETSRKRRLPLIPKAVGVVTSASGAVIHDIMVRVAERFPAIPVFLCDVRVQGDGAAQEIARGIEFLSASEKVDVIIVARGGGSLEDLWAFNEEVVVRAIFAARVPVVSGVGHEVDVTLSDLVADVRAPTPTAAAEIVFPRRSDLAAQVDELARRLLDYSRWFESLVQAVDEAALRLDHRIRITSEACALKVEAAASRVERLRPDRFLGLLRERLSKVNSRLDASIRRIAERAKAALARSELRHGGLVPARQMRAMGEAVRVLEARLARGAQTVCALRRSSLAALSRRVDALNPQAILDRGFAIAWQGSEILTDATRVEPGARVRVSLRSGEIQTIVQGDEGDGEEGR